MWEWKYYFLIFFYLNVQEQNETLCNLKLKNYSLKGKFPTQTKKHSGVSLGNKQTQKTHDCTNTQDMGERLVCLPA